MTLHGSHMLALARGLAVTEMKSHCKNNALSVLSKGAKLVQCNKVVSDGVIEEVSASEKPFLFFIDGGEKSALWCTCARGSIVRKRAFVCTCN